MYSLYQALLTQHARQLTPVRCAEQTIAQLHRYFEDVVLENSLAALVIESLPAKAERPQRALEHIMSIGRSARHAFFFSALLVSLREDKAEGADSAAGSEVVWTFEPDIVYSALEYLMARVTAERLPQTDEFAGAVRTCMPKATSLQLTVSVTTKLARLLQEQAAREVAVNRIASAIRSSLSLPSVLQTTVDEVGRALGVHLSGLHVEGESEQAPMMMKCYFRDGAPSEEDRDAL